jgi:hypothetical protein
MRWLRAGGDLSQPNSIHQGTDRTLMRSEHPPKCLMHSADLPYVQIPRSNPASVPSIIEPGDGIIPIALAAWPVPNFPRLRALRFLDAVS